MTAPKPEYNIHKVQITMTNEKGIEATVTYTGDWTPEEAAKLLAEASPAAASLAAQFGGTES